MAYSCCSTSRSRQDKGVASPRKQCLVAFSPFLGKVERFYSTKDFGPMFGEVVSAGDLQDEEEVAADKDVEMTTKEANAKKISQQTTKNQERKSRKRSASPLRNAW
jgi:hypothetical protein